MFTAAHSACNADPAAFDASLNAPHVVSTRQGQYA